MKKPSTPKPRPDWTYPKPPRGDWISVMSEDDKVLLTIEQEKRP